ncbi:MAG: FHA domain-containing protein [Rhodoferax sp.]|nr:FHA domain-containing protein [Rhodoferax sp.]
MTHPDRKYTVGRANTCDIVLADESVSRVHAELAILDNGKLLVTDCHSTQGTVLLRAGGGQTAVRQEWVTAHDTLRFGGVEMPVRELLRAIQLKQPAASPDKGGNLPAAGVGLVRCVCGAVKVNQQRCEVCGL